MAIHFIGGLHMGHEPLQVHIDHLHTEGYPMGPQGDGMKERMPIESFLALIFDNRREVDIELNRIQRALSERDGSTIHKAAEVYNKRYIYLRRMMSYEDRYRGFADPYERERHERERMMYQRTMMQSPSMTFNPGQFAAMDNCGPAKGSRKRPEKKTDVSDEDVFYLLT